MFILEQFSKHSPSSCSAQYFGFLSVASLTNYWVFISNWKRRDTSTNFNACHTTSQPPRTVHWTVHWFGWSTFGACFVNFDFINIKNWTVLKLKIVTKNELPVKHVNIMPRNRLPRVMNYCYPTGRKNHGRPLKRLLDTWDRNGTTIGPTPWQIDDDDDDELPLNARNVKLSL